MSYISLVQKKIKCQTSRFFCFVLFCFIIRRQFLFMYHCHLCNRFAKFFNMVLVYPLDQDRPNSTLKWKSTVNMPKNTWMSINWLFVLKATSWSLIALGIKLLIGNQRFWMKWSFVTSGQIHTLAYIICKYYISTKYSLAFYLKKLKLLFLVKEKHNQGNFTPHFGSCLLF